MSDIGHTSAKKQVYSCNVCKKSFSQLNKLTQHKKVHESEYEYKCSACGKAFAQKCILDVHVARKHIEKKPHDCDQCGKSFATVYDLQRHIKTHTGSKPHQCDSCNKAFSTSGDLVRHKRIHTGEKPYRCDVCARPFARVGSCLRHQKTHSEGKKHKCDICNEAFTRPWNLQVHKRSHTGEKPYHCDKCTKSFSFLHELKSHKNIHVKKNRAKKTIDETVSSASVNFGKNKIQKCQKCATCGKEFTSKSNMQRHVKVCKESFSSSSSIDIAGHRTHRSTHSEETNKIGIGDINASTATSSLYDKNVQNTAKQESRKIYGKISPASDASAAVNNQHYEGSVNQCVHHFQTTTCRRLEQYTKCDGEERPDDSSYFGQTGMELDDICDTAYVCSLCGVSFETNMLLNNHITVNHEGVK